MKRRQRQSFPRDHAGVLVCRYCKNGIRLYSDGHRVWSKHKAYCYGLGSNRRWAREALARRFIQQNQLVQPTQDLICGIRHFHPETGESKVLKVIRNVSLGGLRPLALPFLRELSLLTGTMSAARKFLRICRGLFGELGMQLVGPLPRSIVFLFWESFGEEHFAPHGRACWCRLCRSDGPARFTFLEALWDVVSSYLLKMPLHALYRLIVPVPLKTAIFILKKVRNWWRLLFGFTESYDRQGALGSSVNVMDDQ